MSHNATCLLPLRRSILCVKLSTGLYESEILLVSEFLNIVLILILIQVKYCILPLKFVSLNIMNKQFL